MATNLIDLIDKVNADDLPTNEFTIEDKDPMVILGKLNEVIGYFQPLQDTISASDSKANEALQKAIQAVADATEALSVANGIDDKATQALANAIEAVSTANSALSGTNTALSTANTAISTANTALSSANSAVETSNNALDTASRAENKADTAITTANGAKTTAEGIDAKATTALENSQTAISTANTANSKAQEAIDQVVSRLGTKVYRDTTLLSNLDIKPIEDDIANNATAINNEATTRANAVNDLDNSKVDKITGKQLSTEDFTTAEKNKLAELNNYDDTQVKADITNLINNTTKIANSNGGFSAGTNSSAVTGGAVGSGATITSGGAVGSGATASSGGAIGAKAIAGGGFAGGYDTKADLGAAVGIYAETEYGASVGEGAYSISGGAVGRWAITGDGFAGGYGARTMTVNLDRTTVINAIQLGEGLNSSEKTLQIYGDNIYDANTHTFTMSQSNTLKWKTKQNASPYIGYCTDSYDGTFVIASKEGSTYMSGLAIGDTSGNLLWKGQRVLSIADQGNNYIRFDSGIQICWGEIGNGNTTVTFPHPFVNTNYSIVACNNTSSFIPPYINNKQTTSATISSDKPNNYIVIGKWK